MKSAAAADVSSPPPQTGVSPQLVPSPVWPTSIDPGASGEPATTALQLPLEYCLPNGLSATPQIPKRLQEPSQPSIVPWVARLAQAVLEVVAAERPVTQLTTWVLPEIYRRLDRRQQVSARQLIPGRPKERSAELVRSVHVCHPVPDVAEVSVVTVGSHDAERCRALALRLERRNGRWICTELDWA